MDVVRVGDIVTRSDGRKYAIIDDGYPMRNISSDVLQLPLSSMLAKNLLGSRVGGSFNYNSQLTIRSIVHSDYTDYVNKKKKSIAKERKAGRESIKIRKALDVFDFRLAEELYKRSRVSDYQGLKTIAIDRLKQLIYNSTYGKSRSSDTARAITDAINFGVISNDEVLGIVRQATIERNKYDRQQADSRRQMLSIRQRAQEAERIRKERETKEKFERERRKRSSYKNTITTRDIEELIHFTNILNLETIMKYGILPRNMVDRKLPMARVNDLNRFDNFKNAICLSVSFPNYKMFFKYRNEDEDARWAVISLKPELLNDFDIKHFFFFKENAAKNGASRCSFEEMFGASDGKNPEDPQAEILAFGIIYPKYIRKIYVQTMDDKILLERKIGDNINIEVNTKYFKCRAGDYI